jgi:CRISPR-associated endonuclease Cas1
LNPPLFAEINTGFEFLGVKISRNELTITDDKYNHLVESIQSLQFNESGMTPNSAKSWDGIVNHYGKLLNQSILEQLDDKFLEAVKRVITDDPQMYSSQSGLLKAFAGVTLLSKKNNSDRKSFNISLIDHYKSVRVSRSAQSDQAKNAALIKSRKLEFQRKEVEHKELIVSSPGTFVGLSNQCVVVKSKGKEVKRLQTSNLSHIIITGDGVSFSSNLLSFCMKNKIPIDIFDNQGSHIGSFLSSKYLEISLWQKQARASSSTNHMIALSIIEGKIKNQFGLIKYFHKYHKTTSATLAERFNSVKDVYDRFHQFAKKPVGEDEKFLVELNTFESSMALRYWGYIRELLLDDNIGFDCRVHKGATDVFNCMLNYGYAILYTRIWQSLLAVGINPYQSIIHHRHAGNPTFVYDVIEIFRSQAVDRIAISMVQKGAKPTVENGRLSDATKKQLSKNIVERLNRFEYYRGGSMRLINIIESQAQELADCFSTDCKFKPYVAKW